MIDTAPPNRFLRFSPLRSERLAAALEKHGGVAPRTVIKKDGETWIEGLKQIGRFEDDER